MNANNKKRNKSKGGAPRSSSGASSKTSRRETAALAQSRPRKTTGASVKTSDNSGQRSCTIRHSELFATISTSTSFDPNVYALNPGQSRTFPWLSVQAAGWERYRFKSLRFEFLSRAAATADGTVTMAVDYDVADEAPDSELEMMAYQGATQDALWKNQVMTASPKSLNGAGGYRYVRTNTNPPPSAEWRQDDAGKLYVQILASSADLVVGSLIAHYEVELVTPQLISGDTASTVVVVPGAGASLGNALGSLVQIGSVRLLQETLRNGVGTIVGTRFNLDNLIPGQPYRALLGMLGTGFTSGTPFTFAPAFTGVGPVGAYYANSTGYQYAFDVISDARQAYIDWNPGNHLATVTDGHGVFSLQSVPNVDPVE